MIKNRYESRGVSADKTDVHNSIKNIDKGLFPRAFCKIVPDYLSDSEDHCIVMHSDGAGTKSSLAYAYWKETGNLDVWKGIAQDAMVMNIDDLMCVGATNNIMYSLISCSVPFIIEEITSPEINFLFLPMVDEYIILLVAPTHIRSSIFITMAS